jgi:hypothetical protein
MKRFTLTSSIVAALAVGCTPTLDETASMVTEPRVLAIRAEPPEAEPNETVELRALFVDPTGTLSTAPLRWTFCNARKPIAELGPIARECLDPDAEDQVALGDGVVVTGALPRDTCRRFGPNPPPAEPGEPPGRPVDPDLTGGYYHPSLAFRTDDPALDPTFLPVRIACGVAGASSAVVVEFNRRYRRNANPSIAGLVLSRGEETPVVVPEDGAGTPPEVAIGETVTLSVAWPSCPDAAVCGDGICGDDESSTDCVADCTTPVGCDGAEHYVTFSPVDDTLARRREAISVTWYHSGGSFAEERTGRSGEDVATTSSNELTAPDEPGDLVVWVVIRDERGGADFRGYRLAVVSSGT